MTAPVLPFAAGSVTRSTGGRLDLVRQVLRRSNGLVGVVILAAFTVLALVPELFVGPLQTAVTATGPRLGP